MVCRAQTILLLQDSEPSDNFNKICLDFYNFFYFHPLLDKDLVYCMDQNAKEQFSHISGLDRVDGTAMSFENWKIEKFTCEIIFNHI